MISFKTKTSIKNIQYLSMYLNNILMAFNICKSVYYFKVSILFQRGFIVSSQLRPFSYLAKCMDLFKPRVASSAIQPSVDYVYKFC